MCCTQCHVFQQYKSGLPKSPDGGIVTFDFIVRMFDGARGKSLLGLLIVSTVNDCEFRISSVSATCVSRDSLSSDFPCVERRDDSIAWADLICLNPKHHPCGLQLVDFLSISLSLLQDFAWKLESSHCPFLCMLSSVH